MSLLAGFRVVQIGDGLAAAVCGRLFAYVGAEVSCLDPDNSALLSQYLNCGKSNAAERDALATADLIVCEGRPVDLAAGNLTLPPFASATRRRPSYSSLPSGRAGRGRMIRRPI